MCLYTTSIPWQGPFLIVRPTICWSASSPQAQPGLETLLEIARVLDVDIKELLNSTRDDVQLVRIQKQ